MRHFKNVHKLVKKSRCVSASSLSFLMLDYVTEWDMEK